MILYPAEVTELELEDWPFDNPLSDYRIVEGDPRASGRLDHRSADGRFRYGIWRCTEGVFECTELGDELQTLLEGRLVLTRSDGQRIECVRGDSIVTRRGERVTWDIRERVTKVFLTANCGS